MVLLVLVLECIHIHVAFIDVHAFHTYTLIVLSDIYTYTLSSHESTFVYDYFMSVLFYFSSVYLSLTDEGKVAASCHDICVLIVFIYT